MHFNVFKNMHICAHTLPQKYLVNKSQVVRSSSFELAIIKNKFLWILSTEFLQRKKKTIHLVN